MLIVEASIFDMTRTCKTLLEHSAKPAHEIPQVAAVTAGQESPEETWPMHQKTAAQLASASRPPEPMTPVDAAWYQIDGPANTAVVMSVVWTRSPIQLADLRALLERRLLRFARFRQRVVPRSFALGTPQWEDVPDFDIDDHLHLAPQPASRSEAALRSLLNGLASTGLNLARPPWQMHLVERVGRGSALVLRYHHCIGDGRAMMTVAARLFDLPPGAFGKPPSRRERQAPPGLIDRTGLVLDGAVSLAGSLLKPPDPPSPFKGPFMRSKHVAWSRPVALEEVKAIGEATGTKINDVLVAATAGALRSYLRRRGAGMDGRTLRAMVPIDLRSPEHADRLGNEFGLVILELPVATADAAQRLAQTHERMSALKRSAEPLAMYLLFDLFGRGPKLVQDVASLVFQTKTSLVMTNVIGPRLPIRLAGSEVERMMFCVPHPGTGMGLGLSLFSYAGHVTLGLIGDARLVPDPELIARAFEREIAVLRRAAIKPG